MDVWVCACVCVYAHVCYFVLKTVEAMYGIIKYNFSPLVSIKRHPQTCEILITTLCEPGAVWLGRMELCGRRSLPRDNPSWRWKWYCFNSIRSPGIFQTLLAKKAPKKKKYSTETCLWMPQKSKESRSNLNIGSRARDMLSPWHGQNGWGRSPTVRLIEMDEKKL